MEIKTIVGLSLVVFSSLMIFICMMRKKEDFFNIRKTIYDHLKIFKHYPSKYCIFYGLPLLFSVGLALIYEAGSGFYTELSVILGIILSMLFAILSILTSQDYSTVNDETQKSKAKRVLKTTTTAIVFDSILSLFLMLYGLVIIVLSGINTIEIPFNTNILKTVASCIAYYVFTIILLNLLFIVKQMSKIIEFNIEVKKGNKEN